MIRFVLFCFYVSKWTWTVHQVSTVRFITIQFRINVLLLNMCTCAVCTKEIHTHPICCHCKMYIRYDYLTNAPRCFCEMAVFLFQFRFLVDLQIFFFFSICALILYTILIQFNINTVHIYSWAYINIQHTCHMYD